MTSVFASGTQAPDEAWLAKALPEAVIAAGCRDDERPRLMAGNATRIYRLDDSKSNIPN